jgi:glycerophosphoryl diester phosphodiesterase
LSKTKIFAHRGASGYAPENTLEAFALAITQGADGIELDVQLTKDGIPVVIHDETIDRVTEKKGWVKDYTLKELKELTVLKNKFPEYSAAKIPTLEEVLDAVKASGIQVNIELKTGIYWYPEIEQKVADLVKKAGMEERVIYSSFNHYSIQQMKKIVPEAETAYLYSDVILNVAEYAKNTKVDGLHSAVYHVKMADFLKEYLGSNLNVRVWTVNEKADMKWLIDAGVTAIITNYPDMAVQIKKEAEV